MTDEELVIVRRLYSTMTASNIGAMLGRSAKVIQQAAQRMRLTHNRKGTGSPWAVEEDELLIANYTSNGAQWCSATLGRTVDAVYERARLLGVASARSSTRP